MSVDFVASIFLSKILRIEDMYYKVGHSFKTKDNIKTAMVQLN